MLLDPFREIGRLDRRMDRLVRDIWGSDLESPRLLTSGETLPAIGEFRMPAIDIKETEKNVKVTAEIPGVNKEDISLNIQDNHLEIKAESKEEKKEEKEGYVYRERRTGSFFRSMELPSAVNANKTKAVYKDGVLSLTLSKSEKLQKTKIKIE